ncbi:MAG: hypothetical protein ACC612_09940 [Methanomethylovorans sp.]|uniref:hypothetical protein n=1 Tax=Methanomethylovorans sp. TaxID=2758717 RepID=UPI0035316AB4
MGFFDFLKKKKAPQATEVKTSSVNTIDTISQSKKKASIDSEINRIKKKYALLESKIATKSPICPECKTKLERMPSKKRSCPHCGSVMIVRTSPITQKKLLLTEQSFEQIEKSWKEYKYSLRWMRSLSKSYNISSPVFSKKRTELSKKFGVEPNQHDVILDIFNDLAVKMLNIIPIDYGNLSSLYFSQAMFLYENNKPFFETLQESNKMCLTRFQQHGVRKVQLMSGSESCKECLNNDGETMTINQALKEMPIPRKDCTYELEKGKPGWCRCTYVYVG